MQPGAQSNRRGSSRGKKVVFVLLPLESGLQCSRSPQPVWPDTLPYPIVPACARSLNHLSAQVVVVDAHITGRGPAFLGSLEVLLSAQWGLLSRGQGLAALDLAPGSECPHWGGKEDDEGS